MVAINNLVCISSILEKKKKSATACIKTAGSAVSGGESGAARCNIVLGVLMPFLGGNRV